MAAVSIALTGTCAGTAAKVVATVVPTRVPIYNAGDHITENNHLCTVLFV